MAKKCRHSFFWRLLLSSTLCILFLSACNSTRFVPEGKYLLNKVTVRTDDRNLKKDELKLHIRQKENLRILGVLKFHLGVYNLSSAKRTDDWLKKIGEAPVLYDEFQTGKTTEQLQIFLKNKGFYNAVISDSAFTNTRKRKVNLVFDINAGKPYRVRNYFYKVNDKSLETLIRKDTANQLLKKGDIFDLDLLSAEQQRIANSFKDRGYYKFSNEFVSFLADTNLLSHQVDLTVNIDDPSSLGENRHRKYGIRNYIINSAVKAFELNEEVMEQKPDTLKKENYQFVYYGKLNYKPTLFYNMNRLKDSAYYSLQNAEKTYRAFNKLKQFKLINIGFSEVSAVNDSVPLLDCRIQLSPLPKRHFSADLEGTNSSGNLGIAGTVNYQVRNLFGGAEVFDIQLRGARERQQTLIENNRFNFNTQEFGLESTMSFPKFLGPVKWVKPSLVQSPETKLSVGYNFQNRPDYTRTISNVRLSYNWQSSEYYFNSFSLIDLNYVRISNLSETFIDKIKDLYIKSSFTDHLIVGSSYSWLFNTQSINKREDYKYFKINLESAGNLLSLYSHLVNKSEVQNFDSITNKTSSYYQVLNTRFAQYVKADLEYRYGHIIDKASSVVGRAFLGIGIPFGNFNVLPFEKKYFTGGANGIRAWQVRSLGPGSYQMPSNVYPNQSSDVKLEANLEYRFKLFWRMEGALFTDAGNIWAINYKDNREGAVFKFDNFYKQIAVSSGLGLRFDFTYFLFRLDLGMKMRDPSLPEGRRFIPGNYRITTDHFNLTFAIGYPF